jgi:hypothetical protein
VIGSEKEGAPMKKGFREISREIASSTWSEVSYYNSAMLQRLTERLQARQPSVLPFVLAESAKIGPQVQSLAAYMTHLIFRMEEKVKGEEMKTIPAESLPEIYGRNGLWLKDRELGKALIAESLRKGETLSHPQLLTYVLEAVLEETGGGEKLAPVQRRALFLLIKSLIDAYEAACAGAV